MTKHHFRVAVRQLRQRPVFSIILIVGLTIGLAAALLVSTVVVNDLAVGIQSVRAAIANPADALRTE